MRRREDSRQLKSSSRQLTRGRVERLRGQRQTHYTDLDQSPDKSNGIMKDLCPAISRQIPKPNKKHRVLPFFPKGTAPDALVPFPNFLCHTLIDSTDVLSNRRVPPLRMTAFPDVRSNNQADRGSKYSDVRSP